MLDVNGDGLDDILRYDGTQANPVRLHTNTGKGISATSSPALLGDATWDWYRVSGYSFARAQFLDYNHDGRDDVLLPIGDPRQPASLRWVVHRTQDRSSTRPELVGTMNLAETALPVRADVDGDGSSDLILAADVAGQADAAGNRSSQLQIRWGGYAKGNFMVTAKDGLGESILFDYARANAAGQRVYERTASCTPSHSWCLNRAGPLVSSVMVRASEREPGNPAPVLRRISFQTFLYTDARRAWYGRGSLGFGARVVSTYGETNDLIETVTSTYDNKTHLDTTVGASIRHWFPYTGRVTTVRTVSGLVSHGLGTAQSVAQVIQVSPIGHSVKLSPWSVPFVVESRRITTVGMQPSGTTTPRTVTSSETVTTHDAFGNPTIVTTARLNGAGTTIERTVDESQFQDSPTRRSQWLIGLRTQLKTTGTRQGISEVRTTTYTYNANTGLPVTAIREPDVDALKLTELATHDEFGNVTRQQLSGAGSATRTTSYVYPAGSLFATQETNPAGHVTTMVSDTALGKTLVSADPNGVVTRLAYDGFGRIVRERGPNGDTVFSYARVDTDTSANVRARVRVTKQIAGGAVTSEFHDSLGRSIETRRNGYAGTTVITSTTYDFADRVLTSSRPHLPNDTSQGVIRNTYDALGRLISVSRPDDNAPNSAAVTNVRYGWPDEAPSAASMTAVVRASALAAVAVTDPLNRRTVQVEDVNEALVATVDTNGSATQVEYGPFDAARRIVDPRGVATTYETDRWGNTTAVVSRDTGGLRHSYTYSAFGQVLQHTDPRGLATTYNYDTLGRTTRRVDPQGTSLWTYDTGVNAIGKLVEARSAAVDFTRLTYEPVPASGPNRGQLASTEQTVNGTSYKFGYTYDAFGRTRRVDYPAARNETFSVSYGYDANGLLTTVRNADSDSLFWTFVGHDQGYRIGAERLGNNVTTTSTFQPLSGRPATTTAAASATTVQQLEYGYDAIGNLKHLRDTVRPDRSRSYVHDTVNRLTSARLLLNNNPATPGSVVESFAYNAGGNLTSKGDVGTYTYRPATDVHPNAAFGAGTNSYTYDTAGNQVSRSGPGVAGGTQTITWTPRNLPAGISAGTGFQPDHDHVPVQRRRPAGVAERPGRHHDLRRRAVRAPPADQRRGRRAPVLHTGRRGDGRAARQDRERGRAAHQDADLRAPGPARLAGEPFQRVRRGRPQSAVRRVRHEPRPELAHDGRARLRRARPRRRPRPDRHGGAALRPGAGPVPVRRPDDLRRDRRRGARRRADREGRRGRLAHRRRRPGPVRRRPAPAVRVRGEQPTGLCGPQRTGSDHVLPGEGGGGAARRISPYLDAGPRRPRLHHGRRARRRPWRLPGRAGHVVRRTEPDVRVLPRRRRGRVRPLPMHRRRRRNGGRRRPHDHRRRCADRRGRGRRFRARGRRRRRRHGRRSVDDVARRHDAARRAPHRWWREHRRYGVRGAARPGLARLRAREGVRGASYTGWEVRPAKWPARPRRRHR